MCLSRAEGEQWLEDGRASLSMFRVVSPCGMSQSLCPHTAMRSPCTPPAVRTAGTLAS